MTPDERNEAVILASTCHDRSTRTTEVRRYLSKVHNIVLTNIPNAHQAGRGRCTTYMRTYLTYTTLFQSTFFFETVLINSSIFGHTISYASSGR